MSLGSPIVFSEDTENRQFLQLGGISVGRDDPNSFDEALLQELIDAIPNVLPVEEYLPSVTTLFSLGREIPVDLGDFDGRIDNLLVTNDGYLVIVETKLYRNAGAIRETITQTLQYGAAIGKMPLMELEARIKRGQSPALTDSENISQCVYRLAAEQNQSGLLAENFDEALERNLRCGEILLLIVSDGIHLAVERVTHWINEQGNSSPFKFGLVELKLYTNGAQRLAIPRTVLKTREVSRHVVVVDIPPNTNGIAAVVTEKYQNTAGGTTQQSRSITSAPPLTRAELLQSIPDDDRQSASNLLDRLDAYPFDQREARDSLKIGFSFPQGGGRFHAIANLTDEGVWVFLPKPLRTLIGPDGMTEFHREANRYGRFYEDDGIEKPDSPSCTVTYEQIMGSADEFVAFLDAYRTKAIGLLEAGEVD